MSRPQKTRIPEELKNAREWKESNIKPDYKSSSSTSTTSSDSDGSEDIDEDLYAEDGHRYHVDDGNLGASSKSEGALSKIPDAEKGFTVVQHKRGKSANEKPQHRKAEAQAERHKRPSKPRRESYQKDNAAQAAFRQRAQPSEIYKLHKPIIEIEPDQQRLQTRLKSLGISQKTFIRLPHTAEARELHIWGSQAGVRKTIQEIKTWVKQTEYKGPTSSIAKTKFAKEYSPIGHQYRSYMKHTVEQHALQQFQQVPPKDKIFEYSGAFAWPADEIRPQSIFGKSLEAFDTLRLKYRCHIVFDVKDQVIWLYSDKEGSIEAVLQRIQGALVEFFARNRNRGRTTIINLVDTPSVLKHRLHVTLTQGQTTEGQNERRHIATLTGRHLSLPERKEWLKQTDVDLETNTMSIQDALEEALPALVHCRASVKMSVDCGILTLTDFRQQRGKSQLSYKGFLEMLSISGTKGVLTRNLEIAKDPMAILTHIYCHQKLFWPVTGTNTKLEDVTRTYSARFEVIRFEKPTAQLELNMRSDPYEKGLFELRNLRWSRLDGKGRENPLSIFMIRLGGAEGAVSWKLHISTEPALDPTQVDPKMIDFADSIKLDPSKAKGPGFEGERVFTWETSIPGCLKPSAFEQRTALQFRLAKAPDWMFEIARYDTYDLSSSPSQQPGDEVVIPLVRSYWGARLVNTEWETILGENQNLGIGEAAKWDSGLGAFFPSEVSHFEGADPGIKEFLGSMREVMECLDELKEMMPLPQPN